MSRADLLTILASLAALVAVVLAVISSIRAARAAEQAREAARRQMEAAQASAELFEAILSFEEKSKRASEPEPEVATPELDDVALRQLQPDALDRALAAEILRRDPDGRIVRPATYRRAVELFGGELPQQGPA